MRKDSVLAIGALFVASSAIAQQPPSGDPQPAVNEMLNQSLKSINECYHGVHRWFNDDLVGRALDKAIDAVFRKAAEPGGLCDQYLRHASEMPLESSLPAFPGVSVNIEKTCKLIRHPRCPK